MASKKKNPLQQGMDWVSQNMNPMDAIDAFTGYFSPPPAVPSAPMMTPMAPPMTPAMPPVDVMGALQGNPLVAPNMTPLPGPGFMEQLAGMAPGMMMAAPLMGTLPGLISHLATGGTPAKMREAERFGKLAKDGVTPSEDWGQYQRGLREDLAPDFVGTDAEGNRVNNKFYNSRNEADLQGEDFVGRSSPYDLFGNASRDQIKKFGDAALADKMVRENKGRLDIRAITPRMEAAAEQAGLQFRSRPQKQQGMFIRGPQGQVLNKDDLENLASTYGVSKKELRRNMGPGGLRPLDSFEMEDYISQNKYNEKFNEDQFRRQQARQRDFWKGLRQRDAGPAEPQLASNNSSSNRGPMRDAMLRESDMTPKQRETVRNMWKPGPGNVFNTGGMNPKQQEELKNTLQSAKPGWSPEVPSQKKKGNTGGLINRKRFD